jgi:hypothetical protein
MSRAYDGNDKRSASLHRVWSDGLPISRSICDTKVRFTSASSANASCDKPCALRCNLRFVARVARARRYESMRKMVFVLDAHSPHGISCKTQGMITNITFTLDF